MHLLDIDALASGRLQLVELDREVLPLPMDPVIEGWIGKYPDQWL